MKTRASASSESLGGAAARPIGKAGRITRRSLFRFGLAAAGGLLPTAGLSAPAHRYLSRIYDVPARRHGPDRNPIIVIPGILGSRLEIADTGEPAWGVLGGGYLRRHFEDIAFPMEAGIPLRELHDDLVPAGVLDRLRVNLGASIQVKAYGQLLSALGVGGYRDEDLGRSGAIDYGDEHFTCFQFGYDWRRSSVENAALLGKFIREKKRYVEQENRRRFGVTSPVKFDVVAHSMGGLVARYFLHYGDQALPEDGSLPDLNWGGARDIEKLIVVGTPNAGSASAARQLINGYRPAPVLGEFPPSLLATMPSLYELLPRARHGRVRDAAGASLDLFDPEEWTKHELAFFADDQAKTLARLLPGIEGGEARREVARDHLRKCLLNAERFHAAMDRPAELPEGTKMYLFAGDATTTLDGIGVDGRGRAVEDGDAPGDGTVTRASALGAGPPHENGISADPLVDWSHTTFIAADHLGLTSNPTFIDNVLHLLLDR